MIAVVDISGKQYKVSKGDTPVVSKIMVKEGQTLMFDSVRLVSDGLSTKVGTPFVNGAKVMAKVVSQGKGEKIDIRRFKSKVRERKHIGFRPRVTTLEIISITA